MPPTPDKVASLLETNLLMQTLALIYNGNLVAEAADELRNEIEAVKRSGKPGALTIKLTIRPDGKGEVIMVDLDGDVSRKKPKKQKRSTSFFIEHDFTLTRDDPRQPDLFPAPAATPTAAKAAAQ